jgi:hypothetical protein
MLRRRALLGDRVKRGVDRVAVWGKVGFPMTMWADRNAIAYAIAFRDTKNVVHIEESDVVATLATIFALARAARTSQHRPPYSRIATYIRSFA